MHLQIKGAAYQNNIATANLYAENITLDMYQSFAGFFYDGYCNFEGDLNLANHELYNIHAYTSQENALDFGVYLNRGNANATLHNITLDVYSNVNNVNPNIGFMVLDV